MSDNSSGSVPLNARTNIKTRTEFQKNNESKRKQVLEPNKQFEVANQIVTKRFEKHFV